MVNISVIVPVFNGRNYLKRCVNSILASQFHNFELILVNDGSTDNSLSICREYGKKDRRVKVIDQKHQGVSAARNQGIRESCGEWIVFVDADDFISEDFLSLIVEEDQEEQDMVIFDFAGSKEWKCFQKKKSVSQRVTEKKQYKEKDNPCLVEALLCCHQLIRGGHTDLRSACAKAYKRAWIQQYSLEFPAEVAMGEDQIFQIDCLMHGKHYTYLKKAVYYVETWEDSVTQRYHPDTWKQYISFIRHLKRTLKNYSYFPQWKKAYYDAVLSNLKGVLVMGIFHPQNPSSVHQKYELCRRIRKMCMVEHAMGYNGKTGDWTRRMLFFFFWLKCYPAVEIICRIGHVQMRWRKR